MLFRLLGVHRRAGRIRLAVSVVVSAALVGLLVTSLQDASPWYRLVILAATLYMLASCSVVIVSFIRSRPYMALRRTLRRRLRELASGAAETVGRSGDITIVISRGPDMPSATKIHELGPLPSEPGSYEGRPGQPFDPEGMRHLMRNLIVIDDHEPSDTITGMRYGRLDHAEPLGTRELARLVAILRSLRVDYRM